MFSWLAQEGPHAEKHWQWQHPITTFLVHYGIAAGIMIMAHDALGAKNTDLHNNSECPVNLKALQQRQKLVAVFLSSYFCLYFSCRLILQWRNNKSLLFVECYRQTFLCSVTIFNAALGFYIGRPVIAEAFCIAVGIDQLLWYVSWDDQSCSGSHKLLTLLSLSPNRYVDLGAYLLW
jgi:hypothetical protein